MMKQTKISAAAALLTALATTNAAGQTSNWTSASGGWNGPGNWDNGIPLISTQNAVLGLASTYTVDLDINADIGILNITNPMATLRIPLVRTLGLNGPTATNNGLITINHNGSSTNARLSINAPVALGGTGEIWMRASSDNAQISGLGILTNGASHAIRGVGRITAPMVNNGTVTADVGVSVSGADLDLMSGITNNSTLSAAASSNLDLIGIAIDQTAGGELFSADTGNINTVGLNTIIGGTIDRAGTGEFNVGVSSNTTMTGVTNNGFIDVLLAGTMHIDGTGLTNNGTIALNQTGSASNSVMNYAASGNLDGTGEVQMRAGSDNSQLNTDVGMTITHAASHTVRGVGRINAAMVNNGTISADVGVSVSGNDLDLGTNDKVNNGDMTAEAGSFLDILGITIDQLGGGDLIANGGTIRLTSGPTIEGGTFTANAGGLLQNEVSSTTLLSGVILNGPLNVRLASTVQVDADGITNNDLMQLNPDNSSSNSNLLFTADATLGGTGEIRMLTGNDNSQINTAAETMVTHVSTHLIRGIGQINAEMTNNGEIRADASVALSGTDLDLQTNDKVNNNLMVAAMGSNLDINGIMIDQSGGGMLVADEGTIRLVNAIIEGGDYLAIGAGFLQNEVSSTSLLSGVTLNGPSTIRLSSTVQVDADGLVNNGVMQMNPGNSSADSNLLFTGTATLGGTGEIQMRANGGNTQINTDPTFTVTHGASHEIRGVGQINAAMVNNGTIRADVGVSGSGNILELQTNDKTNTAVMSAEAGSVLELTGMTLTQTGAGELQVNDGEIRFNGGATLSGGRIEATGTGSYNVNLGAATFHEVIGNAPGEVGLADTLTITGVGFVNNDLLVVNPTNSSADGVIAFPADGFLNTAGGGEVNLTGTGNNSQIDGPGTVTNGPGHTISGRGLIDTDFINGGIIAPGNNAIGTLNASGDVLMASFASMTIEIGLSNTSDRLAVTGTATLAGTLDVVLADAFTQTLNIDYTILTAGSVVGKFDTENLLVDGNLITRILYEPTQVRLVTRCIADTNLDGMVTPTDFTAWVNAFNTNNPVADQNLDGLITPTDFTAWIANFNAGCP